MDTRVSRHYTHDIHQPSTPDKEVDREKKKRRGEGRGGEGRIPKGRQIRKFKACSDIDLGEVPFDDAISW